MLNGHMDPTFFKQRSEHNQLLLHILLPNMCQKQICIPSWAYMPYMLNIWSAYMEDVLKICATYGAIAIKCYSIQSGTHTQTTEWLADAVFNKTNLSKKKKKKKKKKNPHCLSHSWKIIFLQFFEGMMASFCLVGKCAIRWCSFVF